ncbi:hypothetical protein L5M43_14305 [Shewanella sp. SW36]|uniref:hypothetical protein n=1 Tax=unclassified Shewanella TaxID=196818 RepID=UPI0021D9ED37|nr:MULTISPECIES: hypothetical protein [unclassified Shewanella]MCU7963807.1 hypothetical protein [Shewanella sp. SW32]MCU7971633.1 hypothetical protein [Shewanella sp. SW29]MCU7976410.1 hypothetical protein [Shewanella sp. SW36]MCU7991650.1 hypothetical protein [Shewanella sp. SW1]MCU8053030.1 hypothetical protein [Shewanella sp. SM43]
MGLPVTVYRWDDAGAPQMSKGVRPSELINVLKKCLVDGYGSKSGAGWSVPFEDEATQQVVFRNSTLLSSGGFVKFWPKSAGNALQATIFFQSATLLSSLNQSWESTSNRGWRCATGNSALAYKWVIIATAASFYLFTHGDSPVDKTPFNTSIMLSFFVGDIHSVIPNDFNRFITYSYPSNTDAIDSTTPDWSYGIGYISNGTPVAKMHQTDGTDNPKQMVISLSSDTFQTTRITALPSDGLAMLFTPARIQASSINPSSNSSTFLDSTGQNMCNSNLHPAFRGYLPGMLQSSFTGYCDSLLPLIRTVNGVAFYHMPINHVGAGNLWISTGDWYE